MARIRAKNTLPERFLFATMSACGWRFTRHDPLVLGHPDATFRKAKIAVFIDGDFWHGYRFKQWMDCIPPFWQEKIGRNRRRDQRIRRHLRRDGWIVIRIWEHQVEKNIFKCLDRIRLAAGLKDFDRQKVLNRLAKMPPLKFRRRLPRRPSTSRIDLKMAGTPSMLKYHHSCHNGATIARRKIKRLHRGSSIRTLDLFAGCGGLSLGFASAGFKIVAGVENDPLAAESHHKNFSSSSGHLKSNVPSPIDISETAPDQLVEELKLGDSSENAIDVIIGGPPCQAFARVGRAKLREIDRHPQAFLRDQRAALYLRYLQYVRALQPLALVMENVPDALNYGGHNICEEMCEVLSGEGYLCSYTLLNSAFYGVPQMRERVFLFAIRKEFEEIVSPPLPTHFIELPPGYEGTRAVALKSLTSRQGHINGVASASRYYVPAAPPHSRLPPAVTAREALEDLPPIFGHLDGTIRRGTRRFNQPVSYAKQKVNAYCRLMREWPGWPTPGQIFDHVIRSLPRDYPIFREMAAGDQYPEAHAIALRLLNAELNRERKAGREIPEGSVKFQELAKRTVPPYDPSKFPNKWRKMEADSPARTLLAHLGKDCYSHIHYDSKQARTISVREAARLQSFPDGFQFAGTMNPAFRQIGNAVPPLLANAVAHSLLNSMGLMPCNVPLAQYLV